MTQTPSWGPQRSFGRTKARTLKPRQAKLIETLLPSLAPSEAEFEDVRGQQKEVFLEIGFGGGEHLAAQAHKKPDALFVGAEPFLNGVGSLLRYIDEDGLNNVRIHIGDGRDLLKTMPHQSLDGLFVLFADPWPKSRHHKRRLINAETVSEMTLRLKPGARLRFATDWADYANWALLFFLKEPNLEWMAQSYKDWTIAPEDHVKTRYELKALGDCAPVYFNFKRKPA